MNDVYRRVEDGRLRITLLLAPPRTVSTGIAMALAQSPDVDLYVHEPFANGYRGVRSCADGWRMIGGLVRDAARAKGATARDPVRMLIKDSSTHLTSRHFRSLVGHAAAVVVIVRSPLVQLSSVARICKWIWADCPQRFRFRLRNLTVTEIRKYDRKGDLQTYFLDGWEALRRQVEILREPGSKWTAVDAELVRAMPREFFSQIARRAHLRFSERMLSGWRKKHLFNIEGDEWARKAAGTRRFHRAGRTAPQVTELPEPWQGLMHRPLETYGTIAATPQFQSPVSHLMSDRLGEYLLPRAGAFGHLAPDTRYVLAATARMRRDEAAAIRTALRSAYPECTDIFDFVDGITVT